MQLFVATETERWKRIHPVAYFRQTAFRRLWRGSWRAGGEHRQEHEACGSHITKLGGTSNQYIEIMNPACTAVYVTSRLVRERRRRHSLGWR